MVQMGQSDKLSKRYCLIYCTIIYQRSIVNMYCSSLICRGIRKSVSGISSLNAMLIRKHLLSKRDQFAYTYHSTQRFQAFNSECSEFSINSVSADMLTREEAVQSLQSSWKMNDVELQLKSDRERFLNKLIPTIYERVPFQLLSIFKLASLSPNEQKAPTLKEMDTICFSGVGGNCGMLSVFTWRVLKALGYSAYLCASTATTTGIHIHLAVIVKDLVNKGDIHFVDCGLGQPSFTAVSLNFNEESPVYQDSYLEYKFIKHDGKILRMHGKGDLIKHRDPPIKDLDFICEKWRRCYYFSLEDFEQKTLERIGDYFDAACAPKNMAPRAAIFPEGKSIMIMGNSLFVEQEYKTLKKTKLSNEKIFQAYKEYFPSIDEELVQHAYLTWQKNSV